MKIFRFAVLGLMLLYAFPCGSSASTGLGEAIRLYAEGKYTEAAESAQKYAEDYPDAGAYYLIGYALYNLGMFEEANDYFIEAYLMEPEFSPDALLSKIDALRAASAPEKKAVKRMAKRPVKPSVTKPAAAPAAKVEAERPAPLSNLVQPTAINAAALTAVSNKPALAVKPPPAPKGFLAGLGLVFLLVPVALYIYFSLCLFLIARKLDAPAPWTAFVPIAQLWAVVGSSGKPAWWIVLLLVPVVNVIVGIYLFILIAERLGKNRLMGLLIAVPVLNLLLLGLLAFSKTKKAVPLDLERIEEPAPHMEDFPDFGETQKPDKDEADF